MADSVKVPLLDDEDGVSHDSEIPTIKQSDQYKHPYVTLSFIFFRCAPVVTYVLCGFFSDSFIVGFVSVMILLSMDFWNIKNISGRFMVGLRWWNYIDDNGDSHWIFESRQMESKASNDPSEVRVFWTGLFAMPIIWGLFGAVALFTFKVKWLLLLGIALSLNLANLYGYLKCRFGKSSITSSVGTATKSFLRQKVVENVTAVLLNESSTPTKPQSQPYNV